MRARSSGDPQRPARWTAARKTAAFTVKEEILKATIAVLFTVLSVCLTTVLVIATARFMGVNL